jgi:hypothetical protein
MSSSFSGSLFRPLLLNTSGKALFVSLCLLFSATAAVAEAKPDEDVPDATSNEVIWEQMPQQLNLKVASNTITTKATRLSSFNSEHVVAGSVKEGGNLVAIEPGFSSDVVGDPHTQALSQGRRGEPEREVKFSGSGGKYSVSHTKLVPTEFSNQEFLVEDAPELVARTPDAPVDLTSFAVSARNSQESPFERFDRIAQAPPEKMPPMDPATVVPNSPPAAADKRWNVGVSAQAGTLGFLGLNAGYRFSDKLHGRLGYQFGNVGYDLNNSGVDYSTNLNLSNLSLLGDYYPFGGGLRLTGGLVFQGNTLSGTAKPNGVSQVNLGTNSYTLGAGQQIERIGSEVTFGSSVAPYIGLVSILMRG